MLFTQVLNEDLRCASYMLGDAGEAVVVDPRWDVDVYLEIAARERVRICHVVDTHDHADHRSGRPRLAALTGAASHRPARAGDVAEGDLAAGAEIAVGRLSVRALATPGHRPEHLALAVADLSRSPEPWLVLTGDSLLVGDLARPDLAVSPELGARQLRSSVLALLALGDHVEVWPAHVGGSLCGGPHLSRKTSSTIGFERRHNPLVQSPEEAFVAELLANVPPKPPNLAHIVELNRRGVMADSPPPAELTADDLRQVVDEAFTILDARDATAYDRTHIAGAINLPAASNGIGTRAGWAIGVDEPVAIVAEDLATAARVAGILETVGLSRAAGVAAADPEGWRAAGVPVHGSDSCDVPTLASALRRAEITLVDVRDQREWHGGHVPGSMHLPLHALGDGRRVRLPDGALAVACAGGGRAAFAASVLRRASAQPIVRVSGGGVGDLPAHGIELVAGT
jgi:glyoxylase-like metal-dependent hydrolase (beta-lactamase superfamily II)/rhodanese-related sulfurtransferase